MHDLEYRKFEIFTSDSNSRMQKTLENKFKKIRFDFNMENIIFI